jgi:hypothetical protein
MTTKDIMDRAVNLADLQNSGYVTFDDKRFSLNESYRDIYEAITKADEDYFLASATLSAASIVVLNDNQFTIDFPTDFFRLRSVSWQDNGTWRDMPRFPVNVRDARTNTLGYRMRDGKLWVSGCDTTGTILPAIRIDYYKQAVVLTVPDAPLVYSSLSIVPTYMCYVPLGRTLLYGSATQIYAYSLDTMTNHLLYTSTGMSTIRYQNGYIYFVKGGEVWRGVTDLVSTMVAAAITATGASVVSSTLMWDYVYWSTATQCWRANLDGSAPVLRQAAPVSYVAPWGSGMPYYGFISAVGNLTIDTGLATGIAVSMIMGDGARLYYRTTSGDLYAMLPTLTAGVFTTWLLSSGVADIGTLGGDRVPVRLTDGTVEAVSTYPPIDLLFPSNVAYEIMSYQCAIDFKRKKAADATQLEARLSELWARFSSQIHADDFKPERIQNAYRGFYDPWR